MSDRNMPLPEFAEAMTGEKLSPFWRRMLDNPPTVQDRIDAEVRRRRRMQELLASGPMSWAAWEIRRKEGLADER